MSESPPPTSFDGKEFVRELTSAPGVYRMHAADGSVLYVGKASSLKKRVASYFRADQPSRRIAMMVAQIARSCQESTGTNNAIMTAVSSNKGVPSYP